MKPAVLGCGRGFFGGLEQHLPCAFVRHDVELYLHQEGPNLGKTSCPLSPVTIRLDAQFGTPYPRSAGFDTDIGAFIESSSVSSLLGPMVPTIINSKADLGETFLP